MASFLMILIEQQQSDGDPTFCFRCRPCLVRFSAPLTQCGCLRALGPADDRTASPQSAQLHFCSLKPI